MLINDEAASSLLRGQFHVPKAMRRYSDAAMLRVLILDRTNIGKYALDRIISIRVQNLCYPIDV